MKCTNWYSHIMSGKMAPRNHLEGLLYVPKVWGTLGTSVRLSSEKAKWEEEHCLEAGRKGRENTALDNLKSQNFQGKTCRGVSHGCDVSHVQDSQWGIILEPIYEV